MTKKREESREAQLQNRIDELEENLRALEDSCRARNEELARKRHDIRTPLNSIIGFAELIYDGKAGAVTEKHKEFLGDILESGRDLLRKINDVLAPSNVEIDAERMKAPPAAIEGAATILVVEDDQTDRKRIAESLAESGFCIEYAAGGSQAINACRRRRYDAIALDLVLPDQGGWTVLREIRALSMNRDTPVIVVTAYPVYGDAVAFSVHRVVEKPFVPEVLREAVESSMPVRRVQSAAPVEVIQQSTS